MKLLGRSGGSITKGPILFSHGDEYLFVCRENNVLILDGKTANLLRVLQSNVVGGGDGQGHAQPIIGLALHPTKTGQVFTASEDGVICCWDYKSGVILQSWSFGKRVTRLLSAINQPLHRGYLYIIVKVSSSSSLSSSLSTVQHKDSPSLDSEAQGLLQLAGKRKKKRSIKMGKTEVWKLDVAGVEEEKRENQSPFEQLFEIQRSWVPVSLSQDGRRLAYAQENSFGVWSPENKLSRERSLLGSKTSRIMHLTLHPSAPIVYWTDERGCIFGTNYEKDFLGSSPWKMHWHARTPHAIEASPDERHLLSGGEEGVFIVWDVQKGSKHLLPHLSSTIIRAISNKSGDQYAVLLQSNSALLVSPGNMKLTGRYDSIKTINHQEDSRGKAGKFEDKDQIARIGLLNDPRNPSMVLLNSSIPGQLQSFDPLRDCCYSKLGIDICQQNIIGRGKSDKPLIYSDVYAAAFSLDGRWMASYDRRMVADRRLHHDILKFWLLDNNNNTGGGGGGQYQIHSTFEIPHGAPISRIIFSPVLTLSGDYQVATIGLDAKVKIWNSSGRRIVHMDKDGRGVEQSAWIQAKSITFKSFKCNSACYSPDGSILAIAFESIVRLYRAESLELLKSVVTIQGTGGIKEIIIVGDYLIGTDQSNLYVWDLIRMQLIWTLAITVDCLEKHPDDEEKFVIVVSQGRKNSFIMAFTPESPVPAHCYHHYGRPIQGVKFVRAGLKCPPILAILDVDYFVNVIGFQSSDDNNNDNGIPGERTSGNRLASTVDDEVAPKLSAILAAATILPEKSIVTEPIRAKPFTLPRLPHVKSETLLLSNVPSHQLPSNLEAFEHFISFKFPQTTP